MSSNSLQGGGTAGTGITWCGAATSCGGFGAIVGEITMIRGGVSIRRRSQERRCERPLSVPAGARLGYLSPLAKPPQDRQRHVGNGL